MEENKKISTFQLICLITLSEIMHQFTYMPVLHTVPQNQDSWITLFMFIPYVIVLCSPILFLLSRFKNISFFDMLTLILGKVGAKIFTFIFCLFFYICNVACLLLSISFLKIYIVALTPTIAITLAILIPIIYIALKGFKTICRLSVFILFNIVSIVILFFIFSSGDLNFQLLKPIMADSSFLQINIGGFMVASRFSDILILLVASYRLENTNKTKKVFFNSILLYVLFSLLMVIPVITLIGVDYGIQTFNPYYLFARQVEFFTFLRRTEVFVMFSWLAGAIIKIAIYHYLMAFYLAKIFKVKNYKKLVIPVVILSFLTIIFSKLDKSYLILLISSDKIFPWMVLFFILLIPIIIMTVYFIRRKKIKNYT